MIEKMSTYCKFVESVNACDSESQLMFILNVLTYTLGVLVILVQGICWIVSWPTLGQTVLLKPNKCNGDINKTHNRLKQNLR